MDNNTIFWLNKWNNRVVQFQKRHCVVHMINSKSVYKEKHDVFAMVALLMVQQHDFLIKSWKKHSVFYRSNVLIICKLFFVLKKTFFYYSYYLVQILVIVVQL